MGNETNYILHYYTTPISPAPEEATTMEANTAPADDITNELRNETKRNETKLHIITLYYTYITPHRRKRLLRKPTRHQRDDMKSELEVPREKKQQYRIYQQQHIRGYNLKKLKKKKKPLFFKKKKKKKKKKK